MGSVKKSEFYTLTGYKIKENLIVTPAMEDYIEMIYRCTQKNSFTTVKDLSQLLNVRASSVSKMIHRLNNYSLVNYAKYGNISLTNKGKKLGEFYLKRHNVLTDFFKLVNKNNFKLEQVEKVEHYIDDVTTQNINELIKKIKVN